jgi:hypothetical protein
LTNYFSLTAWPPALSRTYGDVNLLYVNADWLRDIEDHASWFSLGLGLFGFCCRLTYWPKGKS